MLTIQENNKQISLVIRKFFNADLSNLSLADLQHLDNSYSLINGNMLTTPVGAMHYVTQDVLNLKIRALHLRKDILELKPITSGQTLNRTNYKDEDLKLVKILESLKRRIKLAQATKDSYAKYGASLLVSFNKMTGKLLPVTASELKAILIQMCKNRINAGFKKLLTPIKPPKQSAKSADSGKSSVASGSASQASGANASDKIISDLNKQSDRNVK